MVVEIGSNDGYLLRHFDSDISCLGVEPSTGPAAVAQEIGIETITSYFDTELAEEIAKERGQADLIIANNVVAHVPNVHNLVSGISSLLKPNGVLTIEVPHLCSLIDGVQFDTIYHEHFSYFSLTSLKDILSKSFLDVFDVERLETHGGSLRIYVKHRSNSAHEPTKRFIDLLDFEKTKGVADPEYYKNFSAQVETARTAFSNFLENSRTEGKSVVGYGAAAKASVILNCCSVSTDQMSMIADKSPYKQGKLIPGVRIPIVTPSDILEAQPDYVVIFPWNIKNEICNELSQIKEWNGSFVTAIPDLKIF